MKQNTLSKIKYFAGIKITLVILFVVTGVPSSYSQFYNGSQLSFGKNRVQYHDFFWTYYRFEKFDTYFYLNGRPLANYTAGYTKKYLKEIEENLEYTLDEKIQFIIFNKLSDLRETNIGLISDEQYNIGGITHIMGTKVFLYFNGDHRDFERQIRRGITNVIINEMMYGSSIASKIKNSTILSLPEWYTKGFISFFAEEWSIEIDNKVRDGVLSGKYEKFNRLTGEEAIYAGHSIWKFIAEKYGKSVLPNIIYMTKISRNVESGFLFVLGVSYNTLVQEWQDHYNYRYLLNNEDRDYPATESLLKKNRSEVIPCRLKVCPDGKHIAYTTNELGQYKVWLYDLETKKRKKLLKSGYKLNEKTDYSYPLLAWHPTGRVLSIIIESKDQLILYYYTVEDKKFDKYILQHFEKILDFSYSQDGKFFVFSAVQKGQSDIFVYNIASHTFEQITKDVYDDLKPCFINNSKDILFCSNRINDTIKFERDNKSFEMPRYTDLFLYNYSKKNRVLRRLTETQYANETQPIEYSPNVISYLCDENGITNRYIARFDSAISFIDTITHYRYFTKSFPITNYSRSIIEHDINSRSKKYAEIIYKDGLYIMYMDNLILAGNLNPVPVKNTYYVDQLRQSDIPVEESLEKPVEEKKKQKRKRLQNVHIGDIRRTKTDTNKIDIDNYTFREIIDVSGEGGKGDSLKTILQRKKKKFSMPKKRNYNVEYSINQMVSQVDFSFLNSSYQQFTGGGAPIYLNPGFNAFIKIGITDLMEDYRITGGVRLSVNLDNNEYLLSYDDLKNRLDKQIVFHRTSMKNFTDDYISRQHTHELHYILKWPFDQVISARGAFILRNDRTSFLSSDLKNLIKDDIDKNWAGVKGEIVYDNTRNIGLNLYFGTRYKIFGEYYQLIDQNQKNLIVIGLDYRKYTKIHRTCIWANRIAASTSFGNSRLIYYMGGVDNWLFPKFNNSTPISQEQHYTYQTLATNMRGFHQNIRNGNSFFVINSEIRFPVFRYFSNKPLKSDFFNNFQIIGFGDLGTAWTGTDPYSKENSLFTQVIPGHPITVTIEKQIEPIVGGYGFGLRSRLIGYFLRADWAWGYEDGYPQPMVFYLSMSLDF